MNHRIITKTYIFVQENVSGHRKQCRFRLNLTNLNGFNLTNDNILGAK